MKRIYPKLSLLLFFILSMTYAQGQVMAVTENGDTIFVYANGTWSFELLEEMPEPENDLAYLSEEVVLDTIATHFKIPSGSKKQVEDSYKLFTIKYNDALWKRVPPATLNDEAEFAFEGKNTDIWCVVIAEETPIAMDKLFLIAKNNMKEFTGSNPEVIKTELRTVNDQQVVRGVMRAQLSGITFIFDTYYYSNHLGSVQFTTWTSDRIWEKNQSMILDLLNGFVAR